MTLQNVPEYPASRRIELTDKQLLDGAFAAHPPEISEFTFTNLYSWRKAYDFRFCRIASCLLIFSRSGTEYRFLPPIGNDCREAVRILAADNRTFIRIPESMKGMIERESGFEAVEDRDNADYVYSTQDLIELKGKKFDGKRNLIRKFRSSYPYRYEVLDGQAASHCLAFEELWCRERDCGKLLSLSQEREAVEEICSHFRLFGLEGGSIAVEGKVCGICIGERLNADTIVLHVMKALPDMKGLYQTLNNEFVTRQGRQYRYVNMEQDLGIEGLRRAKLSYQPVRIVHKFLARPDAR